MTDRKTLMRRLDKMRESRIDNMRATLRRQIALDILDDTGQVSTADVDARMEALWAEPSELALANLMAQKAASGVAAQAAEIDAMIDVAERCDRRVEKCRRALDSATEAAGAARASIATAQAEHETTREFAALVGGLGDADAAPVGESVSVAPDAADTAQNSNTTGA